MSNEIVLIENQPNCKVGFVFVFEKPVLKIVDICGNASTCKDKGGMEGFCLYCACALPFLLTAATTALVQLDITTVQFCFLENIVLLY